MHSLCHHKAVVTQSLCRRCFFAMPSLCTRYAVVMQLRSRYAVVVSSLCRRYALAMPSWLSLHRRYGVAVPLLCRCPGGDAEVNGISTKIETYRVTNVKIYIFLASQLGVAVLVLLLKGPHRYDVITLLICCCYCRPYIVVTEALLLLLQHATWSEFACPANQHTKTTIKKIKPTNLCAPRALLKNVSAIFGNHTILLFWL